MEDQISWIVVPKENVEDWFRTLANAPARPEAWYESHVINYIVNHAEKITQNRPEQSWVELTLGHQDDQDSSRVDVLFVTSRTLWIIEVKHRLYEKDLIGANDQVLRYSKRIKHLQWWPNKSHQLRVFWTYTDDDRKRYDLKPWDIIPSSELDFINRKRQP